MTTFDDLCSSDTKRLLDTIREGTARLRGMAQSIDIRWDPTTPDPRKLHNNYARNLVACYSTKMADLSEAALLALQSLNYLVYALCGRAMLETVATLHYYVTHEYARLLAKPSIDSDGLRKLVELDDQHLRGTRFDWESLLAGDYSTLMRDARARRQQRGNKGSSSNAKRPTTAKPVRIGDCIDRWAEEHDGVRVVYELLCDLVHPNMGSNLLVASIDSHDLYFTKHKGRPVGHTIFEQTLPLIVSVTHKPFGDDLVRLMATIWHDDELH